MKCASETTINANLTSTDSELIGDEFTYALYLKNNIINGDITINMFRGDNITSCTLYGNNTINTNDAAGASLLNSQFRDGTTTVYGENANLLSGKFYGTTVVTEGVSSINSYGNTTITGNVTGGSFNTGSTTIINGNVTGGKFYTGSTTTINGNVTGGTFSSGSIVTINGKISYGDGFQGGCLIKSENATFDEDQDVYIWAGTFITDPSNVLARYKTQEPTSEDNKTTWNLQYPTYTGEFVVTYDPDAKTWTVE